MSGPKPLDALDATPDRLVSSSDLYRFIVRERAAFPAQMSSIVEHAFFLQLALDLTIRFASTEMRDQ